MTNSFSFALVMTSCAVASAQPGNETQERRPEARVSFDAFATSSADIENDAGEVSTSGGGGSLSIEFPAGQRGTLTVGTGVDWAIYDFDGDAGFGAADPWNEIRAVSFNTRYARKLDDTWGWFVGGFASASGEDNADFGESMMYGGFVGATYAASRDFYIAFGGGYATRLEDDGSFLPIINFNWRFADDWTLGSDTKVRGGGVKLAFSPTETVEIFTAAGFRFNEFRLNEDGPTPDGVGADRSFPISIGAQWTPAREVSLGARVGVLAGRQMELSDREGVELADVDVDATPFITAELTFRF